MLGPNPSELALVPTVDAESLNPASHQLPKTDVVLDSSFDPNLVADRYSANRGRLSVESEPAIGRLVLGGAVRLSLTGRRLGSSTTAATSGSAVACPPAAPVSAESGSVHGVHRPFSTHILKHSSCANHG